MVDLSNIPDSMKNRPYWICHTTEKLPIDPKTGNSAKANDPTSWTDFAQAVKYATQHNLGIGFQFGLPDAKSNLVGVDIDGCHDCKTGELSALAVEVLDMFPGAYAEVSPSGTGIHILVVGRLPNGCRNKNTDLKIETYDSGRYFTMTGNKIPGSGSEITADQDAINALTAKYFTRQCSTKTQTGAQGWTAASDVELIERIAKSAQGGAFDALFYLGDTSNHNGDDSAADLALANILAFWCQCNADRMDSLFRQSALMRSKWDRRTGNTTYGQMTIQKAIRDCQNVYDPTLNQADPKIDFAEPAQPIDRIEAWSELIPLTSYELPQFPVYALPDWLSRFVSDLAEATQTPVDLGAMVCLATMAASVAKKAVITPHEGWIEPLNLYAAVALPPGNRKSAVFTECTRPLVKYEIELRRNEAVTVRAAQNEYKALEQALQQAQSAKAKKLAKGEEIEDDAIERLSERIEDFNLPVPTRLLADDSTLEAMAVLLAEQAGRIAVLSPEGDLFDILGGRYSSNGLINLGVVLKGHSGDDIRVDRIGRNSLYIESPALTIGLTVQPDVLNGLAQRPGFRGRGLLARFLYSLPDSIVGRRKVCSKPIPDIAKTTYSFKLSEMLKLETSEVAHVLLLAESAEKAFRSFEVQLEPQLGEDGVLAAVTDWGSKLAGAVARITGILHLAKHAGNQEPWTLPVDAESVKDAITIGEYLIKHAQAAFDLMGVNEETDAAQRFWRWIEQNGQLEFQQTKLFDAVKGTFKTVKAMESGLSLLVERGFIRKKIMPKTNHRPKIVFEVNPTAIKEKKSAASTDDSSIDLSGGEC